MIFIIVIHRCFVSFSLAGKGLLKICKHLSSVWKWKVSNVVLKLLIFTYFYQHTQHYSHSYSSKDSPRSSMDIVWSPPSPGSSTHHFWALVPQGLQWLRAQDGSSGMNGIPGSTISLSTAPGCHSENSLFCMLTFIHFMGRYEEQECLHCLNLVSISPASCFEKKDTDSHR